MTEQSTPQLDAIVNDLTVMCCEALMQGETIDHARVEALSRALVVNGWERHHAHDLPVSIVIRNRVLEQCQEPSMHRVAELKGLVSAIQKAFDSARRYSSSMPMEDKALEDRPSNSALPPRTTG